MIGAVPALCENGPKNQRGGPPSPNAPPPPPDQRDHCGKTRNLRLGKSGWAILWYTNFWIPDPPPAPNNNDNNNSAQQADPDRCPFVRGTRTSAPGVPTAEGSPGSQSSCVSAQCESRCAAIGTALPGGHGGRVLTVLWASAANPKWPSGWTDPALQMAKFYSPNAWHMMTFLNPLDTLIPKSPIFFLLLPNFGSGSPPGPGGQSWWFFGWPVS